MHVRHFALTLALIALFGIGILVVQRKFPSPQEPRILGAWGFDWKAFEGFDVGVNIDPRDAMITNILISINGSEFHPISESSSLPGLRRRIFPLANELANVPEHVIAFDVAGQPIRNGSGELQFPLGVGQPVQAHFGVNLASSGLQARSVIRFKVRVEFSMRGRFQVGNATNEGSLESDLFTFQCQPPIELAFLSADNFYFKHNVALTVAKLFSSSSYHSENGTIDFSSRFILHIFDEKMDEPGYEPWGNYELNLEGFEQTRHAVSPTGIGGETRCGCGSCSVLPDMLSAHQLIMDAGVDWDLIVIFYRQNDSFRRGLAVPTPILARRGITEPCFDLGASFDAIWNVRKARVATVKGAPMEGGSEGLASDIAVHEIGHLLASLEDEYQEGAPCDLCSDDRLPLSVDPNVTPRPWNAVWLHESESSVASKFWPWSDLITDPESLQVGVGVYRGGVYRSAEERPWNWYRSAPTCRMANEGVSGFCAACTRGIQHAIRFRLGRDDGDVGLNVYMRDPEFGTNHLDQ